MTSWRSTPATTTGSRRRACSTPRRSPGGRSTRSAPSPAAGRARRCSSTASTTSTPLQLDALDTIANRCHADVTVSLPWEPGRAAFKAVAPIHGELLSRQATERHLPPLDDHYAPESRAALHHVERNLFGEGGERVEAGEAISLHSAAGRRAEVELAGARVLELLRAGVEPGDVAVVFRRPEEYASLLEQVFGAYGIPFSIDRRVPLGHTGLGRGLLALVRCAARRDASADDLLAWLRTPGLLEAAGPGRPARGEAAARRRALGGPGARRLGGRALEARRPRPPGRGPPAGRLPGRAGAPARPPVRRPLPATAPRCCAARSSRTRASTPPLARRWPSCVPSWRPTRAPGSSPERVLTVLEELEVRLGEPPQPDRVQVAKPEAIRARRFEAVFVCGLQEGEFPSGSSPEPFLPDEDRRAVARASGLRLPGARGPARPRALPLLHLLLARRAAARAVVALERRGGQPAGRVVLRRGRARPAAARRRAAHALALGRHLAARGRAHGRRARAGAGRLGQPAGRRPSRAR